MPAITFADKSIIENTTDNDLTAFFTRIKDWILGFAGALAVLFIILGGIQYITSAGDPKKVETAKKTLTYAIIGLIFIVLSQVILGIFSQGELFNVLN